MGQHRWVFSPSIGFWFLLVCQFLSMCALIKYFLTITAGSSSPNASPSHDPTGKCVMLSALQFWCMFIRISMDFFHCVSFLQATRHARRVYVGGLPPMANEQVFLWLLLLGSLTWVWTRILLPLFGIPDMISGLFILFLAIMCTFNSYFFNQAWYHDPLHFFSPSVFCDFIIKFGLILYVCIAILCYNLYYMLHTSFNCWFAEL